MAFREGLGGWDLGSGGGIEGKIVLCKNCEYLSSSDGSAERRDLIAGTGCEDDELWVGMVVGSYWY